MGKTYRVLVGGHPVNLKRIPSLYRACSHCWEALVHPGWFECVRCGAQGACSHIQVMPHGVQRLSCVESCRQVEWQGYR